MGVQVDGAKCITYLRAWGPPKSTDALRTRKEKVRAGFPGPTPPRGTSRTHPLPSGSRGARVTLGSLRTLLSTVPRLSLWQTVLLREQHSGRRHAEAKSVWGPWGALLGSELHPTHGL